MKSVVVTGASTGIGKSIAVEMARSGWRVFGNVRKEKDALALQAELGPSFVPLLFDLGDEEAVNAGSDRVRHCLGGQVLNGLVNNAGIALAEPLLVQTVAKFRGQIEVNLIGAFTVTREFAPLLGMDHASAEAKGRIINIGSTSGRIGLPFLGAYAASKHGLEGFSESLRRELRAVGIRVIVVAPGTVTTPIYDKAEASLPKEGIADTIWEHSFETFMEFVRVEKRRGLSPGQIARVVKHVLTVRRPQVRYAPVASKLINWTLPTLLPRRFMDVLLSRRFCLTAKDQGGSYRGL